MIAPTSHLNQRCVFMTDEIELDAGTFCYGIPLDEITDMTELS